MIAATAFAAEVENCTSLTVQVIRRQRADHAWCRFQGGARGPAAAGFRLQVHSTIDLRWWKVSCLWRGA